MKKTLFLISYFLFLISLPAQPIQDGFQGNGNISSWAADGCSINTNFTNPFQNGINTSSKVMEYKDTGGQWANVRFDAGRNLNLPNYSTFSFKIYVDSSSLTGSSPNQVSLKLQDANLASPWTTQCEVIKPVVLNQWQTITIDFATDPYVNFDATSPAPTQRNDFNRVLIQVNGENNNDHVTAYIDDFYYYDSLIPPPNYNHLVWADEFNGTGALDTSKWFHQTQLPIPGSWYNGEIQHYTNRTVNSYQQGGSLHLVARRETFTDQGYTKQFTSARLNSKFAFTHGKVEVRAKLPTGAGTWPAIWLLGKNINEPGAYWQTQNFGTTSWPACGEIDIMEHWGTNQNYVSSAIHSPSSFGNTVNVGGTTISTVSSQFHTYTMVWTPNKIEFSVDSLVHYTYQPAVKNSSTWPFDLDHYLLLNTAIQSSITASFTQSTMEIDYVRVYQQLPVGIEEDRSKEAKVRLYPNPVQNQLMLDGLGQFDGKLQIEIYNTLGKQVYSSRFDAHQEVITIRNLSSLPHGIYILNVQGEELMETLKFVKE